MNTAELNVNGENELEPRVPTNKTTLQHLGTDREKGGGVAVENYLPAMASVSQVHVNLTPLMIT